MFERRSVWGFLVGLYVCVLIWLVMVQEPAMLESGASVSSGNGVYGQKPEKPQQQHQIIIPLEGLQQEQEQQEQQTQLHYAGKHLLSKRFQANESSHIGNIVITTNSSLSNCSSSYSSRSNRENKTSVTGLVAHNRTGSVTVGAPLLSPLVLIANSSKSGLFGSILTSAKKNATYADVLAADDFGQLIDLPNFEYLMFQPACGAHTEALILVHSAPCNREKRMLIRETWGSIGSDIAAPIRVVFLLGALKEPALQRQLRLENDKYADMVQGSFVDDYRNMTYKHVMALKWFLYNCGHAQILVKVDDDVYVNTPQLLMYIAARNGSTNTDNVNGTSTDTDTVNEDGNITGTLTGSPLNLTSNSEFNVSQDLFRHPQNLLFCERYIGSMAKRSYRSKWRVSFKEYRERYYPPYCPGYAIIYSADVALRLYAAAQRSKYFWIDDVHITGVLAQRTNTTITTSVHYVLYGEMCEDLLNGKTDLGKIEFLFAWHSISPQQMRALWQLQIQMHPHNVPPKVVAATAPTDTSQASHEVGRFDITLPCGGLR